eukprot:4616287-Pleurochrysis_carterae.AAC.1
MATGCSSRLFSASAGAVETDTDRIGMGVLEEQCRTSCGDPLKEDQDAQQHAEHLQKVRALHERWDKKYDDL